MSGKSAEDYAADHTDPELRAAQGGDQGGRPRRGGGAVGRWGARRSQLLTHEYEAHGGGYRHEGERTESQERLREWTDQDRHTADGGNRARAADGTRR